MSIGRMDARLWAARTGMAYGVTSLLATTAAAHEGHVVGTGFAATVLHALEHGLGVLVVGAAAMVIVLCHRRERRRAARVVARRGDFS